MSDSERPSSDRPRLDLVVPVYNEQATLERSVRTLHDALGALVDETWRITIADNASTDATAVIADKLALELAGVRAIHLPEKGRGRALKRAWLDSEADVVAYLDEDLSTDLRALPPLIAPLLSGHSDVAIGTRLAPTSRVVRGPKREFISRSYNFLLRRFLGVSFSDAQCGFKAMRHDVAVQVLPHVRDTGWFFDTELLVIAERAGLRIHEVPVDWTDDPDSRVDIVPTALADLRGMWRLARGMASGRIPVTALPTYAGADVPRGLTSQLVRFAAVGVASTLAYLVLYLLLRGPLGAQGANFAALLLTALANTAANRRLTFGVRGPTDRFRHQVQGLVVFGVGLALTSASLAVLHAGAPDAARWTELTVLVLANVTATLVRFLLFRSWVFPRRTAGRPAAPPSHPTQPAPARPAVAEPDRRTTR